MNFQEIIIPGKILYLNVCFPHEIKPKDKYFVLVGSGTFPLLLKINTSGNLPEIAKRKGESQFKIKPSVYTFLEYESYLDCGTVWSTLISMDDMVKQLSSDNKRVVGAITDDHKNEIIRRISLSKSVSNRHRQIISDALKKK